MAADQVVPITLATLITLVAYFVRGMSGFGSGLIAIPSLALFLPLEWVVPVVAAVDYLAALQQGVRFRREAQWREILTLLPLAIIGMGLALYLLLSLHTEQLKPYLGGFVILYAAYSLLPMPRLEGSRLWSVPLITTGGVVDTLFGTGGPFYVIYLRLRQLEPGAFIATLSMTFVVATAIRVGGYGLAGLYTTTHLVWVIAAMPLALLAMHLGMRIHHRISPLQFTRLIAVLLVVAGTSLLVQH